MPTTFLNLSTDNTLGGNSPSDYIAVSEKAIKDYVDNHSSGGGGTVDQTYDGTSTNAQSGTAVAGALTDYVTLNTSQKIQAAKAIFGNDVAFGSDSTQKNLLAVISNSNSTAGNWIGRLAVGAKNKTFIMGTYGGICVLGAHSWTNAQQGTGAAWEDVYINPDGNKGVFIGGSPINGKKAILVIQNNNANTTGTVKINRSSNLTDNFKDVACWGDNISKFNNDSGYITSSALNGYATENYVTSQGYITDIDSKDVTDALGYTPYDSSNPDGFTDNVGTVTSVNNTSPDSNGDVTIALPTSGVGLRTVNNAFDIMQDDDPSSAYSVIGTLTTDASNKYKYSGFSNSNYIEATGEFSCGATDTVEIVFCGLSTYTPASGNTYVGHFIGANIRRETNGNLSWTPRKAFHGSANNTQIIKYNTDTSNYPYLKLVRTCTDSSTTFDLYYSSNGTNWTLDNTKTYTNVSYRADFTDYIRIGQIGDSENQYWRDGWADLTGCYVKVNNVMIWNPTSWDNIKQAAKATTSLYGLVKPDGTTISVNNGVISAVNNGTITDVLVDSVSVVNNGIASISFGNLIKTSKSSAQTIQLSSGSDDTVLKLQSRASSSYLSLYGISGFLGSYGVNSSQKPVFYNGSYYTLATKDSSDCPALTPANGEVTWTITNPYSNINITIDVIDNTTNKIVDVEKSITSSTITIKFLSADNITAGAYTALIQG